MFLNRNCALKIGQCCTISSEWAWLALKNPYRLSLNSIRYAEVWLRTIFAMVYSFRCPINL